MSKVTKTMEYRYTQWPQEERKYDLEKLLRKAWEAYPDQRERTISRSIDKRLTVGFKFKDGGKRGYAIYCVHCVDGQAVGVVPMNPLGDADIGERDPDKDENYLNSDFMALIRGDHVISIGAGRNASALRDFLASLFQKKKIKDENAYFFQFVHAAHPDKIKLIEEHGVKGIKLNVGIEEAFYSKITKLAHIKNQAIQFICDLIGGELKDDDIEKYGNATFSLYVDARKGSLAPLESKIKALANSEEGAEFSIHLRNKQVITSSEIKIRKTINLEKKANSVSFEGACGEMFGYMDELIESGLAAKV